MEAELRESPERDRPQDDGPEDEAKLKGQKLALVVQRCPFCHVPVDLAAQEWVACEGCLARHHASCWHDHGSCSSCGGKTELTRRTDSAPPRSRLALAGVLLGVLALAASIFLMKSTETSNNNVSSQLVTFSHRLEALEHEKRNGEQRTALSTEIEVARVRAKEVAVQLDLEEFGNASFIYATDVKGQQYARYPRTVSTKLVELAAEYEKAGSPADVKRVLAANDALLAQGTGNAALAVLMPKER
jgi:hypothetical protein